MRKCFGTKKKNTRSINEYIGELKELDCLLVQMCNRVQMDIKKINGRSKSSLKRRVLLKRHYKNIDERRTQVLARILQLENLHLNSMQVNSLRNVSRAHQDINIDPEDVEELLDKLETFKDDFDEVSQRLNQDLAFDVDISEEELEKELFNEDSTEEDSHSALNIRFPEVPNVFEEDIRGRNVGGSMVREGKGKGSTAIDA